MVKLWVNGKELEADPDRKLMDFLWEDCHLKSVKDGCSEGACGACTVLIDGKPTKACVRTTARVEGKHILTVEGFSAYEQDVFAYAFAKAGAVQCGFCIPGMVICSKALLDQTLHPTRKEIAFALRNNICRCTGYRKIIDAVELAAAVFSGEKMIEETPVNRMGKNFLRVDARGKVLGIGEYVDDLEFEDMTYAGAARSAYPRARVTAIHTQKALELPGLLAVLTADDIPGENKVGHLKRDWMVLVPVGGITHFRGDAICIVVAETKEILEQAKSWL